MAVLTARIDGDILYTPLGVRLPRKYIPHYPHPPQEAFLATPLKQETIEVLYGGAAGGGKTDALLMAALQYVDVPGYSALLLRKTYPELAMPIEGLIDRSHAWLDGSDARWNGDRWTWTFPSGAKLAFGHMQYSSDRARYQGSGWQFIGFDELTHFEEADYRYLFSRLRKPEEGPLSLVPLRMRSASNPGGKGHQWVKRRFIDRLPNPDDAEDTPEKCLRRGFIPARLPDNPSIDQASYLRSLQELEPEVRAQLLEGDWDARQPGRWFFDEKDLSAVAQLGRELESQLQSGDLPPTEVVHLGIDTGEHWHSILGYPLELGGMFVVREYVGTGMEPTESTQRTLGLNELDMPWGRARYDAAGIQSMRTFSRESQRLLGSKAPSLSKIPFGKYKGESAMYLRRLARRTGRGEPFQVLAVSPRCPELLRQLKNLEADPENPSGAWLKAEDQHGPDSLIALVAPVSRRFRETAIKEASVAA